MVHARRVLVWFVGLCLRAPKRPTGRSCTKQIGFYFLYKGSSTNTNGDLLRFVSSPPPLRFEGSTRPGDNLFLDLVRLSSVRIFSARGRIYNLPRGLCSLNI